MNAKEFLAKKEIKDTLYNVAKNDGSFVRMGLSKLMEEYSNSATAIVREKIAEIKEEYIKNYGCNSCWSDEHKCTCKNDEYIIGAFYSTLIRKLKESNFTA